MGCIWRFADNILEMIFYFRYEYFYSMSLKLVPKGPNNNQSLVKIRVSYQTGDKPSSRSMAALFIDTIMHHAALMSQNSY